VKERGEMADLVGTCPKDFWEDWLREGGLPESMVDLGGWTEWSWYTNHSLATHAKPGDRFYVVAHGKLRGYAPVVKVEVPPSDNPSVKYAIIRRYGAVACTIDKSIPGFRGLRIRWWKREDEKPFPDWKTP